VANIALDASGRARFSASQLTVGLHTVVAIYSGDANFDHSTSAPYTQTVNKADTTTTIGSSANPSNFGQAGTFTATVSAVAPGSGRPTGSVTFVVDGTVQAPANLNGGQATFTTETLAVGDHRIGAVYGGDGNFNSSIAARLTQTVNHVVSSTGLGSSVNPSVFGQQVTLTATVSASGGTPSGTVTFREGAIALGTGTLNGVSGNDQATLTLSAPAVGSHAITAIYGGDSTFAPSTSAPLTQLVSLANTSTAVSANAPSSVFGEPISFTATVVPLAPGAGTPTGNVAFKRLFPDGSSVTFGTAVLSASGTAVFVMDRFIPGTATVFAVYAGDSSFATSTSPTITHVINPANTTLTVSSTTPVSVAGQPVNFSSILGVVAPGAFVVPPTGTITFFDTFHGTTTTLTSFPVVGSGTSPALTSAGTHIITATYSGDGNFNGSTSAPITQVVVAAAASALMLVPTQPTIYPGVPFSMTVTALDPYGNTATSYRGTVHFTSSDPQASVPGDGTFTAADNGVHTFDGFVLRTPADQTFTGTDTVTPSITGMVFFQFHAPGPGPGGRGPDLAPMKLTSLDAMSLPASPRLQVAVPAGPGGAPPAPQSAYDLVFRNAPDAMTLGLRGAEDDPALGQALLESLAITQEYRASPVADLLWQALDGRVVDGW
jgi:hypothetical protein